MVSLRVECHTYKANSQHPSLTVTAGRSLCLVRLRPKVDALSLLAGPQVPRAGLVKRQLLCDSSEELSHVLACLGRCFEEKEARLAGILLGIGGGDGALIGVLGDQIELIAGEGDDDVLVCLALELLDPCFCLIERCLCLSTVARDKCLRARVRLV